MKKLTLKLNDSDPNALAMKRLGTYLRHLSDMLGETEHVHFKSVSEGSAMLNVDIEDQHYNQVLNHVREVPKKIGPQKHQKAYQALQRLMDEDCTGGAILDDSAAPVLSFSKQQNNEKPLAVTKSGAIQGRLYMVGGKDETIPVKLEDPNGQTLHCEASTKLAQELSTLLFRQVRLKGKGLWERSPNGRWRLRKLKIESFQELEDTQPSNVLAQMQRLGGLKWAEMEDPHGTAQGLRE